MTAELPEPSIGQTRAIGGKKPSSRLHAPYDTSTETGTYRGGHGCGTAQKVAVFAARRGVATRYSTVLQWPSSFSMKENRCTCISETIIIVCVCIGPTKSYWHVGYGSWWLAGVHVNTGRARKPKPPSRNFYSNCALDQRNLKTIPWATLQINGKSKLLINNSRRPSLVESAKTTAYAAPAWQPIRGVPDSCRARAGGASSTEGCEISVAPLGAARPARARKGASGGTFFAAKSWWLCGTPMR